MNDIQCEIGLERWNDRSLFLGKYVNGKEQLEFMFGVIKVFMKENGKIILFMDLEYINSEMVEYIEDNGK